MIDKRLSILVQINEFTDWSVAQILHPTRILVACYCQCWISQRVSRQMLVLLRWKVRPLMYYQAINSATEARSSIRMCFKDQLQGRFCAGSRLCFLPVCLDVRAPVLILCSLCIFAQKKPDVPFLARPIPVNSRWHCMNFVIEYFSRVTCSFMGLWMST